MKAYFMNEIYELKDEIPCLKSQLEAGEKLCFDINIVDFL